jgi:acyl-coenzyme A synthetase/AMP-(fatty) acid ligase
VRALDELIAAGPADMRATVCVDGTRRLTWQDLDARRAAVAGALVDAGCLPPILATADPFDFLAALLGAWCCGVSPLIPPNFQPGTLAQHVRPDRVLADDDWFARLPPHARRLDVAGGGPRTLILYTSGSSGEPKAVPKTLQQLSAEVAVLDSELGAALRGATVLATVPHHHLYGLLFRLLWPLAAARPFDRTACLDADQLLAAVSRHPDHVLVSSPAHLARLPGLLAFPRWVPPPRAVFSSGAPLDEATAAHYRRALGAAPIEVLGSTESGCIATRRRGGDEDDAGWTPLPSVAVTRAADGALVVSSPWSGGACRLEDEVDLDERGRFRLGARMDRIVKLEGKRVALPEIEARLADHPWVSAAAVAIVPGSARLGCALVLSPAGSVELARAGRAGIARALRQHVTDGAERVAAPRRFRIVGHLPVTERGKIDRAALLSLLQKNVDAPLA